MITSAIKEIRRPLAVKQILRLREWSYSQIRYYFSLEKCDHPISHYRPWAWKSESRQKVSLASGGGGRLRKLSSSVCMSTSVDHEEDSNVAGIESMDTFYFDETSFDHTVDSVTEDEMAHLKVKLYDVTVGSGDKTNAYLERLYDAASIQQVFDVMEDIEKCDQEVDQLKVASQALVAIWDLQKLIFRISANFDPERDYFDRPSFIAKVSQDPLFLEKIVKPIFKDYQELEDEPLVACLLCLKRIGFDMKSSECQNIIEECLRRKDTLSLPSISRLFVCLRSESLYGLLIGAQFLPNLTTNIDTMVSDIEVRLVSISMRNSFRVVSEAMIEKFRTRIAALVEEIPKFETVTLCKVFLLLLSCKNVGNESKHVFDLVGKELIDRVPGMQLMDLLSLQKFLELGYIQPYELVEALVKRMMRIVQEGVSSSISPRLDLLASVAPHLKSIEQRKQLAIMLEDYLENQNFELASGILFIILRWSKSNSVKLYNLFWDKAAEMVENKHKKQVFERRILKLGKDYVNFIYGLNFSYRNHNFEYTVKRYYHQLIENYTVGHQPCLLQPNDFSRCFAFLIGCATLSDPLFYELDLTRMLDDFAPQFRAVDIFLLSRGLEAVILNLFYPKKPKSKYYQRILEISSILEEQCSRILLQNQENVKLPDLLSIHKSALVTRRVKGESPILDVTMQQVLKCDLNDPRSMKDLAQHLLNGLNNYPEVTQKIEDFIWNSRNSSVSPELIEKFVILSFCLGAEVNTDKDVYEFCSSVLTKDWEKLSFLSLLQSTLGLCYFRQLSKQLVQNIFSVNFLDQLDEELSSSHRVNHYPLKLRQAMMELNRAVCLDMPDVNLPWFHEKFCEELAAMNKFQETYMHREVFSVLKDVVGDGAAVQANVLSPYYYSLDFLIEFDEKSRPIKKNKTQTSGFLQKLRGTPEPVAIGRKVAVLILTPTSFTKSVRTLKGQLKLRRRHLEILGYSVIEIDPVHWNSMFMAENSVRHSFLESQLYANMNVGATG